MRRQAAHRAAPRRARGRLHRRGLAGIESEGCGILRARARNGLATRGRHGLRFDLPGGEPARRTHHRLHGGGQDLPAARAGGAAHQPGGEPPRHHRKRRLPARARPPRHLRCGAFLRWLSRRPGVRARNAARSHPRRRRDARALRHQRRLAAMADRRSGPRRAPRARASPRDPRPQRHGVRRRQFAGRGRRGCDAGARDHQRLRRALRERQPRLDHRRPRVEARRSLRRRG